MAGYELEHKHLQSDEPLGITTRVQPPRHRGWKMLASVALIVGSVLWTQLTWKEVLRNTKVEDVDDGFDWYAVSGFL